MNTSPIRIGLSSVALFLVVAILSIASCSPSTEDKDYQAAKEQNTVQAWAAFLDKYPSGKHTEEVRTIVEESLWHKCQNERTYDLYDQYLKTYPKGKYVTEAQEALKTFEALDFESAKEQNTIETWETFLNKYPMGTNVSYAKDALDLLLLHQASGISSDAQAIEHIFKQCRTSAVADKVFEMWDNATWNSAKGKNSTSAYRDYLLRFPGGVHVEEAKTRIEDAIWRTCQQTRQAESYEQYLKEYPSGRHADEARKALDDLAYQRAREKDTIEAYEEFLKDHYRHESAEKRLRQLRYERAVKTGTLEDWIAFYDKYRYSGWRDDGKDVEQMKDNARKEIERVLYERIVSAPSLELCKDYLERYSDGPHKQQVMVKMEPYLFDHAMGTNNVDTYFDYLDNYPEGYRDSEIKQMLNTLIFTKLDVKEDFDDFEKYLRLCPKDKPALMARMEPFMFEWAKNVNTVESYQKYLEEYPNGAHLNQVRVHMDPVLFKKAQEDDWYSTYEEYIKKCPNGQNVQKARERIAWLKNQKAIVKVEYPKIVYSKTSPYYNVNSPFNEANITFKETGGKIGYKVEMGTRYYYEPDGDSYYGSSGGTTKVKAGDQTTDENWWGGLDCGSSYEVTYTGEDAGGHPISVTIRIKSSCEKYKK